MSKKALFLAPFHPKLFVSTFLGTSSVEPFHYTLFALAELDFFGAGQFLLCKNI